MAGGFRGLGLRFRIWFTRFWACRLRRVDRRVRDESGAEEGGFQVGLGASNCTYEMFWDLVGCLGAYAARDLT